MSEAQYQLKIRENSQEKRIALKESFKVGRDQEMDLYIEDPSVSGEHSRIEIEKNAVYVKDLGSTNGTFVNEQKVEGQKQLQNGDVISFGNYKCTFINTKARKIKKIITVYATVNRELQHDIRMIIADKKLSAEEARNCRINTDIATVGSWKITPVCPGCVYTPASVNLDTAGATKAFQWLITPLSRKISQISLRLQRDNDISQDMNIRLNRNGHYANICIRLAFFLPIIFFFLDGIVFKTIETPFLVGSLLRLVNLLGGFTITGILLGIIFLILGLIMNNRTQVIDLYYNEIM